VIGYTRRLPGIRFEVETPPVAEVLPRMDVALFVGFAACGPVDQPVPVEDADEFRAIFGEDLRLAWDGDRKEWSFARLGAAVRSFFQNGGRRCWVIRVAERPVINTFGIPNLFSQSGENITQARARASSPGSWSDSCSVSTRLVSRPIEILKADLKPSARVVLRYPGDLVAGDMLRVIWSSDGPAVLFTVRSKEPWPRSKGQAQSWTVTGDNAIWFSWPPPEQEDGEPIVVPKPGSAPSPNRPLYAERLSFDLYVRKGLQTPLRMQNLAFDPAHPRFWGNLPSDEDFFRGAESRSEETPRESLPELWRESAEIRFPLAWSRDSAGVYFPCNMPPSPRKYLSRESTLGTPLERDGLKEFKAVLFLDRQPSDESDAGEDEPTEEQERLAFQPVSTLLDEADFVRFYHEPRRALRGIHGAFGVTEATMISVPDAVHRGWSPGEIDEPEPADESETPLPIPQPPTPFADCTANNPSPAAPSKEADEKLAGRSAGWIMRPIDEYSADDLLAVHRALIRVCAARGDCLAVLTFPEHYRQDAVLQHVAELTSASESTIRGVNQFQPHEAYAFSYAAVYHPWLVELDDLTKRARANPPDGAACGTFARRALERGPWIAPANEVFTGVITLSPAIPESAFLDLQDAQVNVIRQSPHGFLCLSSDTLSQDPDTRPINVRRLLILLRRLALRVGARYVFEPNDGALRRMVQRGFEAALAFMFERGAFAGARPELAYQVDVSTVADSLLDIDRGRFRVDLRVAPSLPTRFITIRLIQAGDRARISEGS